MQVPSYGLLGKASAAHSARAVGWRWFWVAPFGGGTGSTQAVRRVGAARARAGYARALAVCALGWHLGDAV